MHVLITGGTGLIGQRLVAHLLQYQHRVTVLSRQSQPPAELPEGIEFAQWDSRTPRGWGHRIAEVEAVINLAGAGIADARWSEARKRVIRQSRVEAGQALVEAIEAVNSKPAVLIQASAVGYYGGRMDEAILTEAGQAGDDFVADVCRDWEASTQPVEAMGVRRVVIRTGIVLDSAGGALPRMALPFRFFVGGPIGSGKQWLSWIHHTDEVAAIRFLMEHPSASGPVNLTAPNPVPNREFAQTLGRVLRRPAIMPTPGPVLRLVLGEMATALLTGQRVVPERLQAWGYSFRFSHLEAALRDLLG